MDPGVIANAIVIQDLDRYPLGVWGHADVEIVVGIVADDDAHGLGTMTVSVSGGIGVSARGIIPRVIVIVL